MKYLLILLPLLLFNGCTRPTHMTPDEVRKQIDLCTDYNLSARIMELRYMDGSVIISQVVCTVKGN